MEHVCNAGEMGQRRVKSFSKAELGQHRHLLSTKTKKTGQTKPPNILYALFHLGLISDGFRRGGKGKWHHIWRSSYPPTFNVNGEYRRRPKVQNILQTSTSAMQTLDF